MESIKEMVNLLKNYKMSRIEVLGNPGQNGNSKSDILFNAIKDNTIESEEEAMLLLYQDQEQRANFNRFKNRFKSKLINTIFFIDLSLPSFKDYNRAYYNGYKVLSAIRILVGRGARKAAVELAEKNVKKAIRFEYCELVFQFARVLKMHYLLFEVDKKKHQQYAKLEKKYFRYLQYEMEAEELYLDLVKDVVDTRSVKHELLSKAKKYAETLLPYTQKINTHQFIKFAHSVFYYHYELANDAEKAVEACKVALALLEKKEFKHRHLMLTFSRSLMAYYIKLGQLEDATKVSAKYGKYAQDPPYRDQFQITNFSLMLFFGNFEKAYDIYHEVVNAPEFQYSPKGRQESWRVYEAYLYFLNETQKIDEKKTEHPINFRQFRIGKFLNEVPKFSKDKRGGNITILIIQMLLFLQRKEYSKFIDRTDSLVRYSSRYLKKDDTFRSNCFINMLAAVATGNFHSAAVERSARKYVQKLAQMPLKRAPQSPDLEFIPYELLWKFTCELLDPVPT